jgi:hypothetical protein
MDAERALKDFKRIPKDRKYFCGVVPLPGELKPNFFICTYFLASVIRWGTPHPFSTYPY